MSAYRPVPDHLVPSATRRLSWWRRLWLGRKAAVWHKQLTLDEQRRAQALLCRDTSYVDQQLEAGLKQIRASLADIRHSLGLDRDTMSLPKLQRPPARELPMPPPPVKTWK
jgi:hypothetical protein